MERLCFFRSILCPPCVIPDTGDIAPVPLQPFRYNSIGNRIDAPSNKKSKASTFDFLFFALNFYLINSVQKTYGSKEWFQFPYNNSPG